MGRENDTVNDDERLRLYLTFMETPAEVTRRNWIGEVDNDTATVTQTAIRKWYEKYIQPSDGRDDGAPAVDVEDMIAIFECNSLRNPDRPVNSATNALMDRFYRADDISDDGRGEYGRDEDDDDGGDGGGDGGDDADDDEDGENGHDGGTTADAKLAEFNVSRSLFRGMEFHESTRAYCEFLNGRPDLEKPTYLVELGMFEDAETYEKKRKAYKKK